MPATRSDFNRKLLNEAQEWRGYQVSVCLLCLGTIPGGPLCPLSPFLMSPRSPRLLSTSHPEPLPSQPPLVPSPSIWPSGNWLHPQNSCLLTLPLNAFLPASHLKPLLPLRTLLSEQPVGWGYFPPTPSVPDWWGLVSCAPRSAFLPP